MEISQQTLIKYFYGYLDENNIGMKGCKYLLQANLPKLDDLSLSMLTLNSENNGINAAGVSHLAKAGWIKITKINLSTQQLN